MMKPNSHQSEEYSHQSSDKKTSNQVKKNVTDFITPNKKDEILNSKHSLEKSSSHTAFQQQHNQQQNLNQSPVKSSLLLDNYLQKSKFQKSVLILISNIDNRIRTIEDNQAKITSSLSRFLTKMNNIFFKENMNKKGGGGGGTDFESSLGAGIQNKLYPAFVNDVLSQIDSILLHDEEICIETLQSTASYIPPYQQSTQNQMLAPLDTQNIQVSQKELLSTYNELRNNLIQTNSQEAYGQMMDSALQSQNQNQINDILSEAKAEIRLNKSYSSFNDEGKISQQSTSKDAKSIKRPVSPFEKVEVKNINSTQQQRQVAKSQQLHLNKQNSNNKQQQQQNPNEKSTSKLENSSFNEQSLKNDQTNPQKKKVSYTQTSSQNNFQTIQANKQVNDDTALSQQNSKKGQAKNSIDFYPKEELKQSQTFSKIASVNTPSMQTITYMGDEKEDLAAVGEKTYGCRGKSRPRNQVSKNMNANNKGSNNGQASSTTESEQQSRKKSQPRINSHNTLSQNIKKQIQKEENKSQNQLMNQTTNEKATSQQELTKQQKQQQEQKNAFKQQSKQSNNASVINSQGASSNGNKAKSPRDIQNQYSTQSSQNQYTSPKITPAPTQTINNQKYQNKNTANEQSKRLSQNNQDSTKDLKNMDLLDYDQIKPIQFAPQPLAQGKNILVEDQAVSSSSGAFTNNSSVQQMSSPQLKSTKLQQQQQSSVQSSQRRTSKQNQTVKQQKSILNLMPLLSEVKGDVIDCIGEFTGEDFPKFAFCNKALLLNYLTYQQENLDIQEQLINEQIEELKEGKLQQDVQEELEFELSEDIEEKVEVLSERQSWEKLMRDIITNKLTAKEIIVVRIYFTFLNFKNTSPLESDNQQFLKIVSQHVKKNIGTLDKIAKPNLIFKFSDEIKYRAMELMMKVDLNDLIAAKFSPLVESMLFVIVEALQHLDSLPNKNDLSNDPQTEINTLEFVKESYSEKLFKVESLLSMIR